MVMASSRRGDRVASLPRASSSYLSSPRADNSGCRCATDTCTNANGFISPIHCQCGHHLLFGYSVLGITRTYDSGLANPHAFIILRHPSNLTVVSQNFIEFHQFHLFRIPFTKLFARPRGIVQLGLEPWLDHLRIRVSRGGKFFQPRQTTINTPPHQTLPSGSAPCPFWVVVRVSFSIH